MITYINNIVIWKTIPQNRPLGQVYCKFEASLWRGVKYTKHPGDSGQSDYQVTWPPCAYSGGITGGIMNRQMIIKTRQLTFDGW